MSLSKEEQLYNAAFDGELEKIKSLCSDPDLNINCQDEGGYTPLSGACHAGQIGIVEYLLSMKEIDPNKPSNDGATPFFIACWNGYKEVVSLLLADPRVDPNKPVNDQSTPLWIASQQGHLVVVRHLLASKKEIDTRMRSTFNKRTAAEQGRAMGRMTKRMYDIEEDFQRRRLKGPLCADLIDEYEHDRVAARNRLRRLPGLREYFIGHLFALVVFHSDNFVVTRDNADVSCKRFFDIASRLPLEVQMVLCNRVFGSPKDIILSRDSEPGFKFLVRTTTWQQ